MRAAILLAACVFLAPAALAEEGALDEAISVLAGPWEFSNAGGKACRLVLTTEASIHGFAVTGTEGCAEVSDKSGEIAGWTLTPDGDLRLLDALGKGLLDFEESDAGLYEHEGPGGLADLTLANADESDGITAPTPASLAGPWELMADDSTGPRCLLSLSDLPLSEGGAAFALGKEGLCEDWVEAMSLSGWRLDAEALVLLDGKGGDALRLTPIDPAIWGGKRGDGSDVMLVRVIAEE